MAGIVDAAKDGNLLILVLTVALLALGAAVTIVIRMASRLEKERREFAAKQESIHDLKHQSGAQTMQRHEERIHNLETGHLQISSELIPISSQFAEYRKQHAEDHKSLTVLIESIRQGQNDLKIELCKLGQRLESTLETFQRVFARVIEVGHRDQDEASNG